MKKYALLLLLNALFACSPSSLEEYQEEGQTAVRALTQELQQIHTREELINAAPILKRQFNTIASTIIDADTFRYNNPTSPLPPPPPPHNNDSLRTELNRIYQTIEGGRSLIESYQRTALQQLDDHEKQYLR